MNKILSLTVAACLLTLLGCGGGDDSGDGAPSATGSWSFVDPSGNQETMHLNQSGNQVSGSSDRGGSVSGTADGSACNITVVYANNYTVYLIVNIDGNTMNGTATDSAGHTGTVTATRPSSDAGDKGIGALAGTYAYQSFSVTYDDGAFIEGNNGAVFVNGSQKGSYTGNMTIQSNGHWHQSIVVLGQLVVVDGQARIINEDTLEMTSNGQTYNVSYSYDGSTLTTTAIHPAGLPATETDVWLKTSASAMRLAGEIIVDQEQGGGIGFGVLAGSLLGK